MAKKKGEAEAESGATVKLHPWTKVTANGFKLVPRSSIKPADYNPREIGLAEKVKLRQSLKRSGLVEPLIYNRQTGNLVGGHQRLAVLDEEYGSEDYALPVVEVDLDPTREKELNVALNNPGSQGTYNIPELLELIGSDSKIDVEAMGFDPMALRAAAEQSAPELLEKYDWTHVFGDEKPDADLAADADTIKDMKALKAEHKQAASEFSRDGFYFQVVFQQTDEKKKFLAALDINPEARNIPGRELFLKLRELGVEIDIGWEPQVVEQDELGKPNEEASF